MRVAIVTWLALVTLASCTTDPVAEAPSDAQLAERFRAKRTELERLRHLMSARPPHCIAVPRDTADSLAAGGYTQDGAREVLQLLAAAELRDACHFSGGSVGFDVWTNAGMLGAGCTKSITHYPPAANLPAIVADTASRPAGKSYTRSRITGDWFVAMECL